MHDTNHGMYLSRACSIQHETMNAMKTHTFGVETFAIFEKQSNVNSAMLQFIWGKKDFRIYLNPSQNISIPMARTPKLQNPKGDAWVVQNIRFLNQFEWYHYIKVAGHGLSNEEVLWRKGKLRRYVDLPKGFLNIAVELACRELGFHKSQEVAA